MAAPRIAVVGWLGSAVLAASLIAQNNPARSGGEAVFRDVCATCHGAAASDRVPSLEDLRRMSPDAVVDALTNGPMREQGMALTAEARRNVAEFVTAKRLTTSSESAATPCARAAAWSTSGPAWNGWSPDVGNTRFQPEGQARLAANLVPRLVPHWAFGFPRTSSFNAPPSVVGGRIFMPSTNRLVYALDAASGCQVPGPSRPTRRCARQLSSPRPLRPASLWCFWPTREPSSMRSMPPRAHWCGARRPIAILARACAARWRTSMAVYSFR